MHSETFQQHRIANILQSALLLVGMVALLALLGWIIGGVGMMLWSAALAMVLLALTPRLSPALILRLYGARPLHAREVPNLYALAHELAQRARLPRAPELHYMASPVPTAFTVGSRDAAAITLSDGLLRRLTLREMAGVLAHEIGHIRHNDLRVMALADMVSRLTGMLALLGQLFVLLSLPLILFTDVHMPWLGLLVLLLAPSASALLQLALSRTREFDADLEAGRLTGDPEGLARALAKLERQSLGPLERIFRPHGRNPAPSVLRTHPYTEERIERLRQLQRGEAGPWHDELLEMPGHLSPILRRARRRPFTGLWH